MLAEIPPSRSILINTPIDQDLVDEFNERGFIVLRGLLSPGEVAELNVGYDQAVNGKADVEDWNDRIKPGQILQLGGPSLHLGWREHPYQERFLSIARQLNGDDIEFSFDQLIYKPPHNSTEVLWHQDAGYGWLGEANTRGITCWMALTDVIPEQGSMQFVPGSHQHGIFEHHSASDRNPIGNALEVDVDMSQAEAISYQAGDCSFHHGRTLHYTGQNQTDQPRKSISTHFFPRSATGIR